MVAACEINCRGVIAAGLCQVCERTFCESHRAEDPSTRVRYTSLCSECMAKQQTKRTADFAATQEQQRADEEFIKSGAGARLLRGTGAALVDMHVLTDTYQPRLLRAPLFVGTTTPAPFGRGWLIGGFKWDYLPQAPRAERKAEMFSTVLLESPSGDADKFETYLARVVPDAQHGGYLAPYPAGREPAYLQHHADRFVGEGRGKGAVWSALAARVREVAQR